MKICIKSLITIALSLAICISSVFCISSTAAYDSKKEIYNNAVNILEKYLYGKYDNRVTTMISGIEYTICATPYHFAFTYDEIPDWGDHQYKSGRTMSLFIPYEYKDTFNMQVIIIDGSTNTHTFINNTHNPSKYIKNSELEFDYYIPPYGGYIGIDTSSFSPMFSKNIEIWNSMLKAAGINLGNFGYTKVYEPILKTELKIVGYKENTTVPYNSDMVFYATLKNGDDNGIYWYVNNEKIGPGKSIRIKNITGIFQIYATYEDGNVVKKTPVETVKANTSFFSRIIAFFRGLFGLTTTIEQK